MDGITAKPTEQGHHRTSGGRPVNVTLDGERVRLREFTPDDPSSVHHIVGETIRVTRYLSIESHSRAQTGTMLAGVLERARQTPRTEYFLAVTPAGSGELVGFARLALVGAQAVELGYAIAHRHQGKGYATDAVRPLLRFAFGPLKLHRVTAAIGPENTASLALVQRLGFTREGVLRDHVHTNGAWRDSVLFSILAPEWQAGR